MFTQTKDNIKPNTGALVEAPAFTVLQYVALAVITTVTSATAVPRHTSTGQSRQ